MTTWTTRLAAAAGLAAGAATASYLGLITGAAPLDLGIGRRARPLGPQHVDIAAPRETVFDVISQPYLGPPTHAMAKKIRVLENGSDLVLAAHRTAIRGRLVATTVETVKFHPPDRITFRLVRGPVPHVTEQFQLTEHDGRTRLDYTGDMAADLWQLGQWWSRIVANYWETTVATSLAAIRQESERRMHAHRPDREEP
jgi:Polyketide cyclase / dehydrase and lipid transport